MSVDTPSVMPPRAEEVWHYFSQWGIPPTKADCFFLLYEKKEWRNKKGESLKNWKVIAFTWIAGILKIKPMMTQ